MGYSSIATRSLRGSPIDELVDSRAARFFEPGWLRHKRFGRIGLPFGWAPRRTVATDTIEPSPSASRLPIGRVRPGPGSCACTEVSLPAWTFYRSRRRSALSMPSRVRCGWSWSSSRRGRSTEDVMKWAYNSGHRDDLPPVLHAAIVANRPARCNRCGENREACPPAAPPPRFGEPGPPADSRV